MFGKTLNMQLIITYWNKLNTYQYTNEEGYICEIIIFVSVYNYVTFVLNLH